MNILFIGRFFPNELLATLESEGKGYVGYSNHNFEMSLLEGLSQSGNNVRAITLPGVYSYPHNNKRFYYPAIDSNIYNVPVHSCSFLNLAVVNQLWKVVSLKKAILKELNSFPDGKVHIIVNTPNYQLLKATKLARQVSRHSTSMTVIIPDVPTMITSMGHYSSFKRRLIEKQDDTTMALIQQGDHLVLLTQQMKELFPYPKSFMVMEGLISDSVIKNSQFNERMDVPEKEIILYAGTLLEQFGVLNLVEAFKILPESINAELWICGSGDAADRISNEAAHNPCIKFFGLVSPNEAKELQRKATILVNPRTSDGEYTKYSFPSKTLEYLLARKSVIINRLPGIPEEYYQYVFTPISESIADLAKVIQVVLDTPYEQRREMANKGFDYVAYHKNSSTQVARILSMIETKE